MLMACGGFAQLQTAKLDSFWLWFRHGGKRLGLTATNRNAGFGPCGVRFFCWPRPTSHRALVGSARWPLPRGVVPTPVRRIGRLLLFHHRQRRAQPFVPHDRAGLHGLDRVEGPEW
jgi:hypothetical protein